MWTNTIIFRTQVLVKWHTLIGMLCIFSCIFASAQSADISSRSPSKFVVKAWSTSDGLPHLSVTALAQTRDGYIWVGTLAGLARFDGVSFKVFTPQNCPELPKSRIGGLFEGADGTLFIATERGGGLVALRERQIRATIGCGKRRGRDCCMLEGTLWRFSVRGTIRGAVALVGYEFDNLSTNRDFYPVLPRSVCQDEQGQIWMVSSAEETGRLLRFGSGQLTSVALEGALAGGQVYALAQDTQGQIWLGTSRGLAVLRGGRIEPIELPELGNDVE